MTTITRTQALILLAGLGTLGTMVGSLPTWQEALTPAFVGGAMANVALQVAGILSRPAGGGQ